ncbi:RidA family protein [Antrihabitans stalactiti]|uniref:RidA family protein n=1 Tax=Antrihabitans stalactiti TaxID=2584121 RepID=A0A848KK89_9NOCA|nr:RidA family protein [Antrihabitans stalactiti]NMN98511.1 RidA family protein [Antrihabitans stalactiti]
MSDRINVPSGGTFEATVGYSRAVRVGDQIWVAGTTAELPDGTAVGGDDIGAQAREALRRIVAALAEVGAGPEHVVRTRMFVTDIGRWSEVGDAHGEVFADARPAATMVEVKALITQALMVEIEVDAVVHDGR